MRPETNGLQYARAGPSVFHDVISGNNSVPGQVGFSAGPGYDLVTGLGSLNATALLNAWAASPSAPAASFSFAPALPRAGDTVSFLDTSAGKPTSWSWNFGDGTTAALENPAKIFASAGTYRVTLTAGNSFGSVSTALNITVAPPAMPDLTPYQPAGWSDKIVITRISSGLTDSSALKPTDSLYVDWAVNNSGDATAAVSFVTALYVDGVLRNTWSSQPGLQPSFYVSVVAYPIGTLSTGTHTIRITADSTNAVSESNEANNTYTKTIIVGASSCFHCARVVPFR